MVRMKMYVRGVSAFTRNTQVRTRIFQPLRWFFLYLTSYQTREKEIKNSYRWDVKVKLCNFNIGDFFNMHLGELNYLFQSKKLFEALMSLKYVPVRCKTIPNCWWKFTRYRLEIPNLKNLRCWDKYQQPFISALTVTSFQNKTSTRELQHRENLRTKLNKRQRVMRCLCQNLVTREENVRKITSEVSL